jgi:hypothetical protein
MRSIAFPVLSLLSGPLAAQVVSPAHFARVEGNSESYDPFMASTTLFRYLQVHGDVVGTPRTVQGLAFRMNDVETTAPISIQATFVLSEAAAGISPSNLSPAFAGNHGAGRTTVASGVFFNLPAAAYDRVRDLWPRPFGHALTFAQPFAYTGGNPLVWEVQIHGRQNLGSRGRLDQASGSAVNPSPYYVGYTDRTCGIRHGATPVALDYGDTMDWSGGTMRFTLGGRYVMPGMPSVAWIGLSNAPPLPALIPGSDSAPSGPCYLAASMDFVFPAVSNGSGVFAFASALPLAPYLNGRRLFLQGASYAPGANPLGVVTSNAAYVQFLAPYGPVPVGTVSLAGQLGADGTVYRNRGLVTQLR